MSEDKKAISISSKIFNEISKRISKSENEFSSVDEYVDFALNEILFEQDSDDLSDSEKERVRDELKKLGYI